MIGSYDSSKICKYMNSCSSIILQVITYNLWIRFEMIKLCWMCIINKHAHWEKWGNHHFVSDIPHYLRMGSILYLQSLSQNLMTSALMMTITDPKASPSTCKKTPRIFSCALDSENNMWKFHYADYIICFNTCNSKCKFTSVLFVTGTYRGG